MRVSLIKSTSRGWRAICGCASLAGPKTLRGSRFYTWMLNTEFTAKLKVKAMYMKPS